MKKVFVLSLAEILIDSIIFTTNTEIIDSLYKTSTQVKKKV